MKTIDRAIKMCDADYGAETYYRLIKKYAEDLERGFAGKKKDLNGAAFSPDWFKVAKRFLKDFIDDYKKAGGKRDISKYEALLNRHV